MRPPSDLLLRFGLLMLAVSLGARPGLAQPNGGQTTPDEAANSKTDGSRYSLSGTVINAVSGEPIRRAAVQLSGQNGGVALTDAGGRFVLDLAEGSGFLTGI